MSTNSTPANQIYTTAQIASYVLSSPDHMISFCVQRNPTAIYKFIKANYGSNYPTIIKGGEVTIVSMNAMHDFLLRQYKASANGVAFLTAVKNALPAKAQNNNWTTPVDQKN